MSEDAELELWPNCIVAGCRNKCCLRLNSPFCHPHTMLARRTLEAVERASPIKAEVTTGEADLLRDLDVANDLMVHWTTPPNAIDLLTRCRASIAANASLRAKLDERDAELYTLQHLTWHMLDDSEQVDDSYIVDRTDVEAVWALLPEGHPQPRQSAQAASQPSNPE